MNGQDFTAHIPANPGNPVNNPDPNLPLVPLYGAGGAGEHGDPLGQNPANPIPAPDPEGHIGHRAAVNVNLRIPPPEPYDGKRDASALRSWLFTYNLFSSLHGLTDPQKIHTAALFLRGDAASWWEFQEA